jgi:hypothetical protein
MPTTDNATPKHPALIRLEKAISDLIQATDFDGFGKLEKHKDVKPGKPDHYYSLTLSLPGNDGIVVAGRRVYPSRIQVGINAMALAGEKRVVSEDRMSTAATVDAARLDAILGTAKQPASAV